MTVQIRINGADLSIRDAGGGPAVVLLHGWPHTHRLWDEVVEPLAEQHRVIALDLPGLGASGSSTHGYDARSVAGDIAALLDELAIADAALVAIDAGVPAAFMLAMEAPERVRRLVLMEALLPPLPGAESFLAAGPPWWFGFHAVPGLAETVLAGHEREYLNWFLTEHTYDRAGIDPLINAAFVDGYTGEAALQAGFEYYRAGPANHSQIAAVTATGRLTMPVLAVGGNVVGEALHHQLAGCSDDLTGHIVPDCGHLIPLEQPERLLEILIPFLADRDV